MAELRVQVVDDEIIGTLPARTIWPRTTSRQFSSARKALSDRDDPGVAMRVSEFVARAWMLANDKARELGWGGSFEASASVGALLLRFSGGP